MAASKQVIDLTQKAAEAIVEKLGTDVLALDMTEQLILSEVFLIATAQTDIQVDAIADAVFEELAKIGEKPIRREGKGAWILLDYSDLVVHIQTQELRNYYMLDRLWNDCPRIELKVSEAR
ncbi:MAG: ribosome silencing factor [Actinobacteria bacterium]|jgi:ribosome-associated protein|nr:ribosome silencing factor [Actinomycetota bacterium]